MLLLTPRRPSSLRKAEAEADGSKIVHTSELLTWHGRDTEPRALFPSLGIIHTQLPEQERHRSAARPSPSPTR